MNRSLGIKLAVASIIVLAPELALVLPAGEVVLKNGVTLRGTLTDIETLVTGPKRAKQGPIPSFPILMVSTPLQRYFVSQRQKEQVNKDIDLGRSEAFRIPQQKRSGSGRVIGVVGTYVKTPPPFDQFGRRTVVLEAPSKNLTVIQGVTEITPEYVKVTALDYTWETAIATSSMKIDVLDAMLRQANPRNDPDHRLKIARFYIEAALYGPAQRELEAIAKESAERAETVREAQSILKQAIAQELLSELKLRRAAGQHRFTYQNARGFPVDQVAAPLLREVRDISTRYEIEREQAEQVKSQLAELQAQLKDDPRLVDVGPRRVEISEGMNHTNFDRLDAFRKLADDNTLKPDEKLALALSGWVVGSSNAVPELDQALRLWQARFLVLDYLRTTPDGELERGRIRERLEALEGLSAERIAQLIPLLPPALDPAGAEPGKVVRIQVGSPKDEPPIAYSVMLPPEYHPEHQYPLIVALHSNNMTPAQELAFWGGGEEKIGQAQRHGYIVIAPEYTTKAAQAHYDFSPRTHQIVLGAIRDARRRFSVDSNRVFLSGHQMGGDAAFDIGLSHPDWFAGVIPIAATSDRHCQFYWENARNLPLYFISGELDRDTVSRNTKELMRMLLQNFNLIYVEFTGAGQDSFYSEIHKLFDWMSRHRRGPPPRKST
ncbi:MAG: hypothetical protein ACKV0T_10075 [Planctomycetales bacterium]